MPGDVKVGHVPREIARIYWYFLEHDGEIVWSVVAMVSGKLFDQLILNHHMHNNNLSTTKK